MSENLIIMKKNENYVCIILNRPEKGNAMNRSAQLELQAALEECRGRYPVVIITGADPAFCSGIDQEEQTESPEYGEAGAEYSRSGNLWFETIEMIRKHPAVFIAAVNGDALGDGISLINVCDLAIAEEGAKIGLPDITFASYPSIAGPSTQLRVLRKHASYLILTGKTIDSKTAQRWGLINLVVAKEKLMDEAKNLAAHISQFNEVTLDWTKKALGEIPGHVSDWTAALEYGRCVTSVVQNKLGKDKVVHKKF